MTDNSSQNAFLLIAARTVQTVELSNALVNEIQSIRDFLRNYHDDSNCTTNKDTVSSLLPPIALSAADDMLCSVLRWLEGVKGSGDATPEEIQEARRLLHDEMIACGLSLHLEVATLKSRRLFLSSLAELRDWLSATRWKTGPQQPLSEAARFIISDFCETQLEWASHEEHIASDLSEFDKRLKSIRCMRNEEDEQRTWRLMDSSDPALLLVQRHTNESALTVEMVQHVMNRAITLRNTPPAALSIRQRRQAAATAQGVLDWMDTTTNKSSDDRVQEVADQLTKVLETSRDVSAAADLVARRNEFERVVSLITSSLENPHVECSIGCSGVEGLRYILTKVKAWMDSTPKPTVTAYDTFIESLYFASSRLGLSLLVASTDEEGDERGKQKKHATSNRGVQKIFLRATNKDVLLEAVEGRMDKSGNVLGEHGVLQVTVACSLLEGLQYLKITAVGCKEFKASGSATQLTTLQAQLQVFLNENQNDNATHLVRECLREVDVAINDRPALTDNSADNDEVKKMTIDEEGVTVEYLVDEYVKLLTNCEKIGLRVPTACWLRPELKQEIINLDGS